MEKAPKVFISYSWSSPEYLQEVLDLASDLMTDGIEVVLDRWHLEEGHDAYEFMERTVNDSEVDRVLVLCDPVYAAKANSREGGVGTETAIISAEVYGKARQTKFIPVIMARDVEGAVVVPTYLKTRKYVDLSRADTYSVGYDALIRRLHGKQELLPPPLGRRPAYLDEEVQSVRQTGRTFAQYRDALVRGQPGQRGKLGEYLTRLAKYTASQIVTNAETEDELFQRNRESVDMSLPYRDEFVSLIQSMAEYAEDTIPLQ